MVISAAMEASVRMAGRCAASSSSSHSPAHPLRRRRPSQLSRGFSGVTPSLLAGGSQRAASARRFRDSAAPTTFRSTRRASAVPEDGKNYFLPLMRNSYHPSEEIGELVHDEGQVAHLTDAETARTVVEVNSKATLLVSGFVDDGIQENIIWPNLPYLTDENGDIYFDMEEELVGSITDGDRIVQVVIGLENAEMLIETEVSVAPQVDLGIQEILSEDSNDDDNSDDGYEDDEIAIIEEDDGDDADSSDEPGNWANLETVNSCHPLYFATRIAEVAADRNIDWMGLASTSVVVQGHLQPAFVEESSMPKQKKPNGDSIKDQNRKNGPAFYKLEIMKIQLITAYGTESMVDAEDFSKARPDVIAHSAGNIIARLRSGGEKITNALKSLCWRLKAMQAEEVVVVGVDSLGFDLRVCTGTQIQTVRFAFHARATSEFGAEKQLHDILFPKQHEQNQKQEQKQEQKDSCSGDV